MACRQALWLCGDTAESRRERALYGLDKSEMALNRNTERWRIPFQAKDLGGLIHHVA